VPDGRYDTMEEFNMDLKCGQLKLAHVTRNKK